MSWCPRCDVLTGSRAGDECPSCGAEVLDATSLTASRSARQVLELERVGEPITTGEPVTALADGDGPPRVSRRAFGSRFLKVALATTILAGSALYAFEAAHDEAPKSKPSPTSSATPIVAPPLGNVHDGSVAIAIQNGIRFISLEDGSVTAVDPPGQVSAFAVSPSGEFVAHLDSTRLLTVTRIASQTDVPAATEVDFFAWTPEENSMLVVRRQLDTKERERWRLESLALDTRETTLLLETPDVIASIFAGGSTVLFERYDAAGYPNVYELRSNNSARLLRKRAAILDLSSDGSTALLGRRDAPGLLAMDMSSRRARPIGSSKLVASFGRIARDGSSAAVVATTNYTLTTHCEHESPCPNQPIADDAVLWTVALESLNMREILRSATNDLGRPAWGPSGAWLFLLSGEQPVALSLGTPIPIPIMPAGGSDVWLPLEYVP